MFSSKLYCKYLGIALIAVALSFFTTPLHADMSFNGSGGGGGGGTSQKSLFDIAGNGGVYDMNIQYDGGQVPVAINGLTAKSTTQTTPNWTTNYNNEKVLNIWTLTGANFSSAPATGTNRVNTSFSSGIYGMFVNEVSVASSGTNGGGITGTFAAVQSGVMATIGLAPSTVGGAAPTFVNATTLNAGSGSATATINVPSGSTAGTFSIYCLVWYAGATQNITMSSPAAMRTPALVVNDFPIGTSVDDAMVCYSHVNTNSEPASYSWTQSVTTSGFSGFGITYSGATIDDPWVTTSSHTVSANQLVCGDASSIPAVTNGASTPVSENCGTVSFVTSGTSFQPTFGNATNVSTSAQEWRVGTDNKAAINATVAQALAAGGGRVWIGGAVASSDGIALPANGTVSVSLAGPGGSVPWWILGNGASTYVKCDNFLTGTTCADSAFGNTIGAGIGFLTKNMTQDGVNIANTAGHISQRINQFACDGLTLWAGAGIRADGGSATANGIHLTNTAHAKVNNCNIVGFGGNGVLIDDTGTTPDYGINNQVRGSYIFGNGANGVKIAGGTNIQDTVIDSDEIESNGLNGVDFNLGTVGANLTITNNIIQWDNVSHTVGGLEVAGHTNTRDTTFKWNWIEFSQSNTTETNLALGPGIEIGLNTCGNLGPAICNDGVVGCAGQAALTSGTPSTATVSNACITGATNVIQCTDCSGTGAATAPIRCVPSASSLAITGPNTVTDTVCWTRVQ